MKFVKASTLVLGALSLLLGAFLIRIDTNPSFSLPIYCRGNTFYVICSGASDFTFVFLAIGVMLAFIALPLASFGFESNSADEEPSLFNKRTTGLSLIIPGGLLLIYSLAGFEVEIASTMCYVNGCPSILSATYLGTWILVSIGAVMVLAGIVLILLSRSDKVRLERNRISSRDPLSSDPSMI